MNETTLMTDEVTAVSDRSRGNDQKVRVVGHVVAEMYGPDGQLKSRVEHHNLITAIGDRLLASRAAGLTTSALPTGMKLGAGSTAVAKTGAGAALVTYLADSNKAFDATFPSEAAGVVTFKRTYAAGEATTASPITEAVIVTDAIGTTPGATSTAANTAARVLLAGIGSKGAGDSLTVTWAWTVLGA